MALDLTLHPCFNSETRHRTARIHLPVAPRCNIQCNYCNRKFDCMNESRPGVTSAVLSPRQALQYLGKAIEKMPNLAVVGIAGPGDPFASPEETLETLRLVRQQYPEMLLCVATNGLSIHPYVDQLAQLQVSHVTFTVNAVDPAIGSSIYSWVRDGHTIRRGDSAACVLLQRQRRAIAALKKRGIVVKINTIVVPGINDHHVEEVAKEMSGLGADIMNCIPMYPVADTPFEKLEQLKPAEIIRLRKTIGQHLPQMTHCTRCRADAVGMLGEAQSAELVGIMRACATGALEAHERRPYVAVASMEGVLVNQHLGEASRLWIYEQGPEGLRLIGTRETPEEGGGNLRWLELAESLQDCRALLVSGVGRNPRRVIERQGIRIVEMAGLISEGVASLYRTGDVPRTMRKHFTTCGAECQGSGMGCS
jgi:nitrogen fixation protein NifB